MEMRSVLRNRYCWNTGCPDEKSSVREGGRHRSAFNNATFTHRTSIRECCEVALAGMVASTYTYTCSRAERCRRQMVTTSDGNGSSVAHVQNVRLEYAQIRGKTNLKPWARVQRASLEALRLLWIRYINLMSSDKHPLFAIFVYAGSGKKKYTEYLFATFSWNIKCLWFIKKQLTSQPVTYSPSVWLPHFSFFSFDHQSSQYVRQKSYPGK